MTMKKTIFTLIIMLAAFALCACGGEEAPQDASFTYAPEATQAPTEEPLPEIFESSHPSEEGYLVSFRTHAVDAGRFTLHMADTIYEEAALRELVGLISPTVDEAVSRIGTEPAHFNVYVVKNTMGDVPAGYGTSVVCTRGDIDSGAYVEPLVGAAWELNAPWQKSGLAGYVFGQLDDAVLREFYSDPENALTASCSPLHFEPQLAGEEQTVFAKKTALSLASFIISEKGFDAFRAAENTEAYLPEWLDHLGVSQFALPEGNARACRMTFRMNMGYLCEIRAENFTVSVKENGWATTADELYAFVCNLLTARDRILDKIRAETPSIYEHALSNAGGDIEIIIVGWNYGSYANMDKDSILLGWRSNTVHELTHLIIDKDNKMNSTQFWLCEGLAEYFSLDVSSELFAPDRTSLGFDAYLDMLFESTDSEPTENDMRFHRCFWALYNDLRSQEFNEHDDCHAFDLAYGIASILYSDVERTPVALDSTVASPRGWSSGDKSVDSNGLSYYQAVTVLEYLMKEYGEEHIVLDYVNDVPVEESTGKSYPELYAEAKAYIEETYGSYFIGEDQ